LAKIDAVILIEILLFIAPIFGSQIGKCCSA
jgi:hypothetical protein